MVEHSNEILDIHLSQITFQAKRSPRLNSQHKFDVGSKVYVARDLTGRTSDPSSNDSAFEVLCAVVASADGRQKQVMSWVVGRTCVQQRACDIHTPLPRKTLAACSRGFTEHWSTLLQLFRAHLSTVKGRMEAGQATRALQCAKLARILRKASLDQRAAYTGDEVAAEHLTQAFKIATSAPLRISVVCQVIRHAVEGAFQQSKARHEDNICPAVLLGELERQVREDGESASGRTLAGLLQAGLRQRLAKLAAAETLPEAVDGPRLSWTQVMEAVDSVHSNILLPEEFFCLLCSLCRVSRAFSRTSPNHSCASPAAQPVQKHDGRLLGFV